MTITIAPRPKRIWIAAVMNILSGALGIFVAVYLALNSKATSDAIGFGPFTAFFGFIAASFLIAASILALLRRKNSRWLMLAAACSYFGIIAAQNILVILFDPSIPGAATQKLWTSAGRSTLEVAINVWALCSAKSIAFFEGRPISPSIKVADSATAS